MHRFKNWLGIVLVCAMGRLACGAEDPAPAPKSGSEEWRFHLWPLAYVDAKEVKILGPIFHKTAESFAIRPLFAYNWTLHRLRLLYPLAQIQAGRESWIVPWFWGPGYRVLFPLYWDHYSANERTNLLLPIWGYTRDGENLSWWTALGLVGGRKAGAEEHHRVLPLYSWTRSLKGVSGWFLWPLGRVWSDSATGETGRMFLPFLYRHEDRDSSTLLTPLYGSWSRDGGDRQGRVVVPFAAWERGEGSQSFWSLLGAYHRDGERRQWWWWPLLTAGSEGGGVSDRWWFFPLARFRETANSVHRHVFPLFYHTQEPRHERLLTPLYARGQDGATSWSALPPLLSWSRQTPGGRSRWILAPLVHLAREGERVTRHVFPLFYQSVEPGRDVFATLLGGRILAEKERSYLVYPLLSWRTVKEDRADTWALAPLVHWSSGPARGSRHVVPLFYENPATGAFLSALYTRVRQEGGRVLRTIPPLASWWSVGADDVDAKVLFGLGGAGGEPDARYSYLFPVYYRNDRTGALLTPLYARWQGGRGETHSVWPPLAAWRSRGENSQALRVAAGLAGWGRDPLRAWSYLFPLWYRDSAGTLLTPLAGRLNTGAGHIRYLFTPLVATREGDRQGGWVLPLAFWNRSPDGLQRDAWLLWSHWWRHGDQEGSGMFPLWRRMEGRSEANGKVREEAVFNTLFVSRYSRSSTRDAQGREVDAATRYRLWPLWYASRQVNSAADTRSQASSFLLGLVRNERQEKAGEVVREKRRWLWYLYRRDRDGDRVKVDIFPSITYDRMPDGSERRSFLWAVYRSEKSPDGAVRRRVLGIPF